MHSNRKSIRLKGYNYSNPGYYFVTICTYAKRKILGNVSNQQSVLSAAGNIVLNCWHSLTEFFSGVTIDSSAIMPNHFHGIIKLNPGSRISLSQIVRNFKSVSARRIRAADPTILQVWQRNYYERIIRTERELNLIRLYIDLNPLMWTHHLELPEIDFTSEEEIAKLLGKYRNTL